MEQNHFMGQDGFVWFVGVVEDRDDPDKLGRVRVRCLGYHTEDLDKIPTTQVPSTINGGVFPIPFIEGFVIGCITSAHGKVLVGILSKSSV